MIQGVSVSSAHMQASISPDLKFFLDRKVKEFERPSFIKNDPISIPHLFSKKQDIEIAALFAAVFSWGNRTTIIHKAAELMRRMDMAPHEFCKRYEKRDFKRLKGFKHRTFNEGDVAYFVEFLHEHYSMSDTLETAFSKWMNGNDHNTEYALNGFRKYFFLLEHIRRTEKQIFSPLQKS